MMEEETGPRQEPTLTHGRRLRILEHGKERLENWWRGDYDPEQDHSSMCHHGPGQDIKAGTQASKGRTPEAEKVTT